jgi:hypothetical protein
MKRALVSVVLLACGSAQHPTANAGPGTRTAAAGATLMFDASASTGPITRYTWDFGDGSPTVDAEMTSHAYAMDGDYTVSLTVHGPGGADATSVLVTVGSACAALAKIVPETQNPMPGDTVLLGSTGSMGCMGANLMTYDWDFGDGNTVSGDASKATVSHVYTTMGTYMVKLHVVDVNGKEGRATLALGIGVVTAGKPQVICQMSASGQTGKLVSLTASGSDPGGMMLTYVWSFSDGGNAMGSNVTRSFSMAGSYTATVVATTTDNRMSDPCMTSITISDPINYTGTWILSPASGNLTGCPFSVGFPSASISVFQTSNPDGGGDILTVTPNGGTYPSGYPLTGTESTSSPGTFVVKTSSGPTEDPGGTCSLNLTTSHTIHLNFTSATAVSGSWTKAYTGCYDVSCNTACNCTAGGQPSGNFTGFPM